MKTNGKSGRKIFVIVNQGVAEVVEDTVPSGWAVEIIDLDSIREGDDYPSAESGRYIRRLGLAPS
jgi:hypothetical protein